MKIKELIGALVIALATTWLLQYFFIGKPPITSSTAVEAKSGQKFYAPQKTEVEVHKPLNTEVDFIDTKQLKKSVITTITTDNGIYEFTTDGAALHRVDFKRTWGGRKGSLSTVFPPAQGDKERSCFLLGLQENTPFYYDLESHVQEADRDIITYKSSVNTGTIVKKFTIYKHSYRIDLDISIENLGATETLSPRIFFPSPLVTQLAGHDIISGISNDMRGSVVVHPKTEETLRSYWANPTLFGTQDRYFVHAMVHDTHNFAQRGYYKIVDLENLYSIIEGPSINQATSWSLQFYFGPKEDSAMNEVDPRLEQTLNYGWFSFISKPLSKLMLHTLNWLYGIVHNYGFAIILLTILIKLLLLPFTWRDGQSMRQRAEFQKKLEHLGTKYKHDPQALAQARAELVRKYGMSGFAGCLPLLLQLPVFWALSIILSNAIELYQAPFLWIPDLTARDPYFILPALTAIAMVLHSPQVTDPKQRISSLAMALIVAAVIASLSSGLALFTVVSTLLGVLQAFIVRKLKLV